MAHQKRFLKPHYGKTPKGFEAVFDFGDLGKIIRPKTPAQRKALGRRYKHRPYVGTASGRSIYFPKHVYNVVQANTRHLESKAGIDYLCPYEYLASEMAKGRASKTEKE